MKITIKNYEAYMLDLIEGNISLIDKENLFDFLKQNPELNIDITEFDDVKLIAENKIYENKNSLKKDEKIHIDTISEIDRLSIAFLENDITLKESDSLEVLLKKQPKKQFDFSIIQQTKLKAEKNIEFKHKDKLKKKLVIQKYIRRITYLAAAILILFIGFKSVFEQFNIVNTSTYKIAYVQNDIKIREQKIIKKVTFNNIKENKKHTIDLIDTINTIAPNSNIINEQIAFVSNIKANSVIYEQNKIENLIVNNSNYSNNIDYDINEKEIEKRIEQVLGKKSVINYEKQMFASVINKFKKYIKRKFHIKQTVTEGNRKVIAFKAGNYKYYINRPNSKKKIKKL